MFFVALAKIKGKVTPELIEAAKNTSKNKTDPISKSLETKGRLALTKIPLRTVKATKKRNLKGVKLRFLGIKDRIFSLT